MGLILSLSDFSVSLRRTPFSRFISSNDLIFTSCFSTLTTLDEGWRKAVKHKSHCRLQIFQLSLLKKPHHVHQGCTTHSPDLAHELSDPHSKLISRRNFF